MNQSAKVIAHSVSAHGGPSILTMEIHIWRPLLAELNTHRAISGLSGSAASSRAVPIQKRIDAVRNSPYVPKHWPGNMPGMVGSEQLHPAMELLCKHTWLDAAADATYRAGQMAAAGVHKAIPNRILEPFHTVPVVLTGTEDGWENFFALRTERMEDGRPVADPEFCDLADEMLRVARDSKPVSLGEGCWHLPYVSWGSEWPEHHDITCLKMSAARCARVSYENHDGTRDIAKDIALHDRLLADGHMSPMEHQATPSYGRNSWTLAGNFNPSWIQYRKTLKGERRTFKIWER